MNRQPASIPLFQAKIFNAKQEKMELEQTECILCGACVDTCPQGAIRYAWTEKKQQEQIPHPRNMSGKQ